MTGSTMPAGDESTGKTYLGDAVYIGRWRGGAVMWTTDGYTETNRIFLEREVISELIRWLARNTTTKRSEA